MFKRINLSKQLDSIKKDTGIFCVLRNNEWYIVMSRVDTKNVKTDAIINGNVILSGPYVTQNAANTVILKRWG